MEKEKALGDDLKFEDILDEVAGVYPKIMHEGTMEVGAWSCGMVAGLVNDIPTVEELVNGIMSQANEIIESKLSSF
jgi:nitronate monooxygenase